MSAKYDLDGEVNFDKSCHSGGCYDDGSFPVHAAKSSGVKC